MTEPLQFGENPLVPSRAYATGWPTYARQRWERFLASYRERVADLYSDLAGQHPECFTLQGPLDVRVVVSLTREWVFIKPAATDCLTLDERWQDQQLAHRSMYSRADHERGVRDAADVDDSYELFEDQDLSQRLVDLHMPPSVEPANPDFFGREAADLDAATAIKAPELRDAIAAMMGRALDRHALAKLEGQLEFIANLPPKQRGKSFETWFGSLLEAHGCQVEPGRTHEGEQVDFFVHQPFRAVIECRWKKSRLQPRELADLTAKLNRRPAIIAGIYVAWSGFTDSCSRRAAHEPSGRTVLLWEAADLQRLLKGEIHARDLYEEHVSDRVRSYKIDS
ncbi:restriction endonuclease [Streptomyces microflavus]|uniref:restriction endonuclease n=1 Tax=Streptomyces microflavus TaxID=1919 RepID=UPI0033ABD5D3